MAEKVGSLLIDLAANVATLQQDMNKATGLVKNAATSMGKAWEDFQTIVKASIAGESLREVVKAAADGERSVNLLTAAFKRQGEGVGIARDQLEDMAVEMSKATEFKDSDFRKAEATLLSFGNIYGDVFKQAITLSADLAAKDGNLAGATDAIGKALANPIEGMKGLGAAIGKLTPQQTEMIKNLVRSNDVLGAQNYILGLVREKVGGTAAELNTGYVKSINDAAKAWDTLKERLGEIALLKGTVVTALQGMATAAGLIGGVIEGSSEPLFGKRIAMYREMLALQEQIAAAQKTGGNLDLSSVDEFGRVQGESTNIDELTKKLIAMRDAYDKLFLLPPAATNKPKIGLTEDQIAYLKGLDKQLNTVNASSNSGSFLAGQFAQADQLKVLDKARPKILAINQAMQEQAEILRKADDDLDFRKKLKDFTADSGNMTSDLDRQTAALGSNAEALAILAANLKNDEAVYQATKDLTREQTTEWQAQADLLQGKYLTALRTNLAVARQWQTGVKQAFSDLQDQANDKATQAKNLVVSAFQGMEDALVKFAQTGKLNFNDLANSIIADLIRIQIKQNILGPLAGGLGGLFGGGGGASAVGGSGIGGVGVATLATGTNYVPQDMFAMIHKGEAVVPREYNNGGNGSGSSVVINQSINVDSRSDFQSIAAAMSTAKQQAKAEILNSISRNGQFAGAVRSVR